MNGLSFSRKAVFSLVIQSRPVSEPREDGFGVLHLTSERGWRGGERQVLLLMRELHRLGIAQALAAPAGSPLAEFAAGAGFRLTPLHPTATLHPVNLLRLLRALPGSGPPILHAHTSPALTLASAVRRLRPVSAVLYTRRTAFLVRPSRKYHTAAEIYVAVSEAAERRLRDAGTPDQRIRRIPDAVDLNHVRVSGRPPSRASAASRSPTVVTVGHLSPEKGHRVLVEGWPTVLARVPGARLWIAGAGPERGELETLVQRLSLAASVRLLGFCEDVGDLLAGADVFVMPSLEEGLGTAVLEAMAMGLPVVASRTGGLPEVVGDGITGVLVPPGEPLPLADAVVRLLQDREASARMGAAGRRRAAAQFSAEGMATGYLGLYRELVHAG